MPKPTFVVSQALAEVLLRNSVLHIKKEILNIRQNDRWDAYLDVDKIFCWSMDAAIKSKSNYKDSSVHHKSEKYNQVLWTINFKETHNDTEKIMIFVPKD